MAKRETGQHSMLGREPKRSHEAQLTLWARYDLGRTLPLPGNWMDEIAGATRPGIAEDMYWWRIRDPSTRLNAVIARKSWVKCISCRTSRLFHNQEHIRSIFTRMYSKSSTPYKG